MRRHELDDTHFCGDSVVRSARSAALVLLLGTLFPSLGLAQDLGGTPTPTLERAERVVSPAPAEASTDDSSVRRLRLARRLAGEGGDPRIALLMPPSSASWVLSELERNDRQRTSAHILGVVGALSGTGGVVVFVLASIRSICIFEPCRADVPLFGLGAAMVGVAILLTVGAASVLGDASRWRTELLARMGAFSRGEWDVARW